MFEPKISHQKFLVEKFFDSKIISSKPDFHKKFNQTFFGRKCFVCLIISSKTGLYQQILSKIFWSLIFCLQNHFLGNRLEPKIFIQNLLVEHFLWLQNHFLGNRFKPKIFIQNLLVGKFFMVAKS
jgi:hypothetical protein